MRARPQRKAQATRFTPASPPRTTLQPFEVVAPGCRSETDGAVGDNGWVLGTYIHGLFDSPDIVERIIGNVAKRHGLPAPSVPHYSMEAEFDRLADVVRANLDMDLIYSLVDNGRDAEMTPDISLVIGGVRSGKSRFAADLASRLAGGGPVCS